MTQLKFLLVLSLAVSTVFTSCEKDEENDAAPLDRLEAIGILGRWEIADEAVNGGIGISDLLPRCCRFLEFTPDDNIDDHKGLLTSTSAGPANMGTFEVDVANQTILFIDDDDDEFIFSFLLDDSQENLTIDYFTEDGTNYIQRWVRRE